MTPALTALLAQLLPYAVAAVGGWLVRHYHLIGPKTPAVPAPTVPAMPASSGMNPLLQAAEEQLVALLEQAVQDALKRMTPPPAAPKIAG